MLQAHFQLVREGNWRPPPREGQGAYTVGQADTFHKKKNQQLEKSSK